MLRTSLVVWTWNGLLPGCSCTQPIRVQAAQKLSKIWVFTSAPLNLLQKETVETSFRVGDEPSRGGGRGRGRGEGEHL